MAAKSKKTSKKKIASKKPGDRKVVKSEQNSTKLAPLEVHYIKGNFFRVVHANGVFGGITPKNEIQMDFFSERWAIPQVVRYELSQTAEIEGGQFQQLSLGNEIDREGKDGAVREVEVGVTVSLETAKSMLNWLKKNVEQLESIQPNADVSVDNKN